MSLHCVVNYCCKIIQSSIVTTIIYRLNFTKRVVSVLFSTSNIYSFIEQTSIQAMSLETLRCTFVQRRIKFVFALNFSFRHESCFFSTIEQEACARVLLFRGADPTIVNKSNQTAYELALVSQNNVVASIIQTHKSEHVVPFREIPLMNSRRRSIYFEKDRQRTRSTSQTPSSIYLCNRSQSLPKLNGINLLQSGTSEQQNSSNHENDYHVRPSSRSSSPKSFSVHSDHGLGSECNSHHSSRMRLAPNDFLLRFIVFVLDSPNETPSNYSCQRKRLYAAAPGRKCMCIKSYKTNVPGELALHKGEIVESKTND